MFTAWLSCFRPHAVLSVSSLLLFFFHWFLPSCFGSASDLDKARASFARGYHILQSITCVNKCHPTISQNDRRLWQHHTALRISRQQAVIHYFMWWHLLYCDPVLQCVIRPYHKIPLVFARMSHAKKARTHARSQARTCTK